MLNYWIYFYIKYLLRTGVQPYRLLCSVYYLDCSPFLFYYNLKYLEFCQFIGISMFCLPIYRCTNIVFTFLFLPIPSCCILFAKSNHTATANQLFIKTNKKILEEIKYYLVNIGRVSFCRDQFGPDKPDPIQN